MNPDFHLTIVQRTLLDLDELTQQVGVATFGGNHEEGLSILSYSTNISRCYPCDIERPLQGGRECILLYEREKGNRDILETDRERDFEERKGSLS